MTGPEVPASLGARRRLVMLAIRRGDEHPPAGLETVAVQVALRQSSLKWITWLYVFGFLVEVALVLTAKTDSSRVLNVALAVLFFLVARAQYRAVRRAAEAVQRWDPHPGTPGPASDPDGPHPPRTS